MQNVQKYDYTSLAAPVSNERVHRWTISRLSKLLPVAMMGSKNEFDPITAQQKAAEMIKELQDLYAKGVNGDWVFGIVIAQKPQPNFLTA